MHIRLPISVATRAAAAVSGSKEETASMCLVIREADVTSDESLCDTILGLLDVSLAGTYRAHR